MKKKLLALALTGVVILTGCNSSSQTISELSNLDALNSESTATNNYVLSYTEEQKAIYAQVSDRSLLDLSSLDACEGNDLQQVLAFMNNVDNQLIGRVKTTAYTDRYERLASAGYVQDEEVINSCMTDYLLSFMEQTPYYWQRTNTTVRGIDSASHSIIVDVVYKTIDFSKTVVKDSYIVLGDPDYEDKVSTRYAKWMEILKRKTVNAGVNDSDLALMEADFKKHYGDVNDIIASQINTNPTSNIYLTGNQQTYSGLVDTEVEKVGGTLSVRYVLTPNYVLGVNLGLACKHMYIMDYVLDVDPTENLSIFTNEGYATITDSVYRLIYSYFTCLDESDYQGLYKLMNNFKALDKHYSNVFNSTYQKHNGFSVSLFDITGTHITCGVAVSSKERAMGSNMTYPIYTDKYFVSLDLVDDRLSIDNIVLISRKLEGEPKITTEEADVQGFSASINLDNEDKLKIEDLICNFSALQLNQDTTSDEFSALIDTSLSTNQLEALKGSISSLSGAKKVVFLENYQQGTSNYALVKCRELFQDDINSIIEAEVTYEFILKGGSWYIYNYSVLSTIKLDTTNLTITGSLCLVTPGKVESYTSQLSGSNTSNKTETLNDISVVVSHDAYTPAVKEGSKEQGLVKIKGTEVDASIFESVGTFVGWSFTSLDEYNTLISELRVDSELSDEVSIMDARFKDYIAVVYNILNLRYQEEEKERLLESSEDDLVDLSMQISTLLKATPDANKYSSLKDAMSKISLFIK